MVKKYILYIFIYILTIGCHTLMGPEEVEIWPTQESECISNYELVVEAPNLLKDEAGYYYIEYLEGYEQTFTTLSAETGSVNFSQKVFWGTESGIYYMSNWVSSVNHTSYTGEDGIANTVLAVWEEQIGDTIIVYAGYEDNCGIEYHDNIGVIVK